LTRNKIPIQKVGPPLTKCAQKSWILLKFKKIQLGRVLKDFFKLIPLILKKKKKKDLVQKWKIPTIESLVL